MPRLDPSEPFTLPTPNFGTYRWVNVIEEWEDCNSPSQDYVEQLQIINEEVTWKELDREQIVIIAKAWLKEARRKRLAIK